MIKNIIRRGLTTLSATVKIDPIQEASLKETCILVNDQDEVIGNASKRDCHLVLPNGDIPLHRAFSVFLFNTKGELLLQKRSDTKITFPGHFTNTCCSHPLIDFYEEREEKDAIGVKLAAQRRLYHELGIPKEMIILDDFIYLTRILYKSVGDGIWGEHEIDYILVLIKDLPIHPNPEEVSETLYISKDNFYEFLHNIRAPITPWFSLVTQKKLNIWWNNLDKLDKFQDHVNIHNFK
ncbi:isopentenyl-diphosphate delta isomerase [Rhodnius prolixus]|uniref:isopentenyl-diphosphate delta isomerase n=1 Tax=Rhodnius prolixus TaxID=13249 RepID=UPI003D189DF9